MTRLSWVCLCVICCTVIATSEAAQTAELMAEPTAEPALNASPDGVVQEFADPALASDPSVPEWIQSQNLDPLGPIFSDERFSGFLDGQSIDAQPSPLPTQYTPSVPSVGYDSGVESQNIKAQSQQLRWYQQQVQAQEAQAQQQRQVAEALTQHAKTVQSQVKAEAQQVARRQQAASQAQQAKIRATYAQMQKTWQQLKDVRTQLDTKKHQLAAFEQHQATVYKQEESTIQAQQLAQQKTRAQQQSSQMGLQQAVARLHAQGITLQHEAASQKAEEGKLAQEEAKQNQMRAYLKQWWAKAQATYHTDETTLQTQQSKEAVVQDHLTAQRSTQQALRNKQNTLFHQEQEQLASAKRAMHKAQGSLTAQQAKQTQTKAHLTAWYQQLLGYRAHMGSTFKKEEDKLQAQLHQQQLSQAALKATAAKQRDEEGTLRSASTKLSREEATLRAAQTREQGTDQALKTRRTRQQQEQARLTLESHKLINRTKALQAQAQAESAREAAFQRSQHQQELSYADQLAALKEKEVELHKMESAQAAQAQRLQVEGRAVAQQAGVDQATHSTLNSIGGLAAAPEAYPFPDAMDANALLSHGMPPVEDLSQVHATKAGGKGLKKAVMQALSTNEHKEVPSITELPELEGLHEDSSDAVEETAALKDSDHNLFKTQFQKAVQLRLAELKKQQTRHSKQEQNPPEPRASAATALTEAPEGAVKDRRSVVDDGMFKQEEEALHTMGLVQESASEEH